MSSSRPQYPLLPPPDLLHAIGIATPNDIPAILEEFALRSLLRGVRVRQWCAELKAVLDTISPPSFYLQALRGPNSVLSCLFPFLAFTSAPPSAVTILAPTALLPLQTIQAVSAKQVVEALTTLSRTRHIHKAEHLDKSIFELCLEFVGYIWRRAIQEDTEQEVVGVLTKTFIEIEFELQCVGDPTILRSIILPILRTFRFSLGFISPHRLASRLSTLSDTADDDSTARALISSWLTRRLSIGVQRSALQDHIGLLLLKIRSDHLRDIISSICADYHLSMALEPVSVEHAKSSMDAIINDFGLLSPPVSIASLADQDQDQDHTVKKGWISWGKHPDAPRNTLSKSKWFGHRRNHTSMSKLTPPSFNPDRRPSLPILPHLTSPSTISIASPATQSANSLTNSDSTALPITPRTPHLSRASCLTTAMASSELTEVINALTDHLLDMRYKLNQPDGTWFLGEGKTIAIEIVSGFERRLRGKYHPFEIEDVFYDLRTSFDLPEPSISLNSSWSSGTVHGIGTRPREKSDPVYLPLKRDEEVISPMTATSRATSFDLDQYLRDIGGDSDPVQPEQCAEDAEGSDTEVLEDDKPTPLLAPTQPRRRISFGASSILSVLSRRTSTGRNEKASTRGSVFSQYAFSIREAKRELPYQAVAVEKGLTVDTADRSSSIDGRPAGRQAEGRRVSWRQNLATMSTPNLATLDKYTTMPYPFGSLRRRAAVYEQPRLGSTVMLAEEEDRAPRPSLSTMASNTLSAPELSTKIPDDVLSLLAALDETPPSQSVPATPNLRESPAEGRERRQRNRRFAIVDQIEVSPTKRSFASKPSIESVIAFSEVPRMAKVSTASSEDAMYMTAPTTPIGLGLQFGASQSFFPPLRGAGGVKRIGSGTNTPPSPITTSPKDLPIPLEVLIPILQQCSMGAMFGMSEMRITRSLERFIELERSRTEQLGQSWDDEARGRSVWVLEQVGQMIEDPSLKYLVHSAIRQLRRSSPPLPRSLKRDTSNETLAATSIEPLQGPLFSSRSFESTRTVDTLDTFGQ